MTTITKVDAEVTTYGEMKTIADLLKLDFNGKSRQELAEIINAEIDNRGEEITVETEQPINETSENDDTTTGEQVEQVDKDDTTQTDTTKATSTAKWYEGGYGNVPGDRVTVIGKHIHQSTDNPKVILQGRTAIVIGPSKKLNMIQAKLIDQKTGSEQNCVITLAIGEYANEGTVDVKIPERKTRSKSTTPPVASTPEVTPVEETNPETTETLNEDQTPVTEEVEEIVTNEDVSEDGEQQVS